MFPAAASAQQESLTLDSAITKALRYNYDLRISDNTAAQSAVNNTLGNAGLLPAVNATLGTTTGTNNTLLETTDGNSINRSGFSYGYNGGVNLTWTIFAAGRGYLVKKQLTALQNISEAQFRAQVQATVSEVIQAYALTVYNRQQITALDTSISLARARMELSQAKFEIGTSAKVDYLQGRVDLNSSRSQLLTQQAAMESAGASLNALMGEDEWKNYDVADSMMLNISLEPAQKDRLQSSNPLLEAARINVELGSIKTKIARTFFFPTVGLNAGYGYNYTNSKAGQFSVNRGFGPTGGLALNLPLYQGGNIRRQVKVAGLQALSDELAYGKQNTELSRQYRIAWSAYKTAVAAYLLEEESIGYARENLDIQKARFRVGIATSLELREAENSYVQALDRKNTASYNVKMNETRVLELESKL